MLVPTSHSQQDLELGCVGTLYLDTWDLLLCWLVLLLCVVVLCLGVCVERPFPGGIPVLARTPSPLRHGYGMDLLFRTAAQSVFPLVPGTLFFTKLPLLGPGRRPLDWIDYQLGARTKPLREKRAF